MNFDVFPVDLHNLIFFFEKVVQKNYLHGSPNQCVRAAVAIKRSTRSIKGSDMST